jgi:hypothetical protein
MEFGVTDALALDTCYVSCGCYALFGNYPHKISNHKISDFLLQL